MRVILNKHLYFHISIFFRYWSFILYAQRCHVSFMCHVLWIFALVSAHLKKQPLGSSREVLIGKALHKSADQEFCAACSGPVNRAWRQIDLAPGSAGRGTHLVPGTVNCLTLKKVSC